MKERHILSESAIIVEAGEGKEDRLLSGSYIELHHQRTQPLSSDQSQPGVEASAPAFNHSDSAADTNSDPFGITPDASDDESPF